MDDPPRQTAVLVLPSMLFAFRLWARCRFVEDFE